MRVSLRVVISDGARKPVVPPFSYALFVDSLVIFAHFVKISLHIAATCFLAVASLVVGNTNKTLVYGYHAFVYYVSATFMQLHLNISAMNIPSAVVGWLHTSWWPC